MIKAPQPHPLADQAELFEFASDAIILTDADGAITYWNSGASRIYGWENKEALGQNLDKLLPTDFSGLAADPEEILRSESHWEGEIEQIRHDGKRICVLSRWTIDGTRSDSPRLLINTDITARKQEERALREKEQRYRRFVTEDFTGTLIMRADGQIVTCNPAVAEIFGFDSIEEAGSANFFALLRSRQDAVELLDLVRQQTTLDRHELEMRQRDGDPVYVVARLI